MCNYFKETFPYLNLGEAWSEKDGLLSPIEMSIFLDIYLSRDMWYELETAVKITLISVWINGFHISVG